MALTAITVLGCGRERLEAPPERPRETPPAATGDLPKLAASGPPPPGSRPPADARRLPSGIVYRDLAPGEPGDPPAFHDRVQVRYRMWRPDGQLVARSHESGAPAVLRPEEIGGGWGRALTSMRVGGRRQLWLDAGLTGEDPAGKPRGPMVMEVELLGVHRLPPPLPPPADLAQPPASAETTASGLRHRVLRAAPASGARPALHDRVRVEYAAWRADGRMFDASSRRGGPAEVAVELGPPGWVEALALLRVGEKRRFWMPPELTFRDFPGTVDGPLVYDIELLEVIAMPAPPPAPPDVAAPPRDATRSDSGLASRVLHTGRGKTRPAGKDAVDIHYTSWTPGGRRVETTITRDQPQRLKLARALPGLREALSQMVVGEKRRVWVPAALAYADNPGPASGDLVYDLELVAIYRNKRKLPE